ncbi:ABC transporter ATP-binding protein [Candidatus Thorarchaeota archaeon]|nr:MAG: ABC transporter ATP-binding protein [Candidatus Thorarchaeota archaeon]
MPCCIFGNRVSLRIRLWRRPLMVKIEIDGMLREFPDGTSVGPIDLAVEDGELMVLLGPSGSGKTTTLRMIAGFIESDTGKVCFDGFDVISVPPSERNIGMVVQSVALFPNMTVFQNIAFGLEVNNWAREETIKRVEELADILGIKNLLHRRIDEISGGEGQRVALARALARRPRLLLLDEPLSALDPKLRERLQDEIKKIQRQFGITTIYVTHDQVEAFAVADKIAVLQNGVIKQVGTPDELYFNPKDAFVAQFIGHGNILNGEVIDRDDHNLKIQVKGGIIETTGDFGIGEKVALAFKPEAIKLDMKNQTDTLSGQLESVTPHLGGFKVILSVGNQKIVSFIADQNYAAELQDFEKSDVGFSIDQKRLKILT